MQFGETPNGYPTVTLTPPLEPFAEFFRAAHSIESATNIRDVIAGVLAGERTNELIPQDYAELMLDGNAGIARVRIDNLSKDTEETAEVSLGACLDLASKWCDYLQHRKAGKQ